MVAQREQLHPGARCPLHHLGGLERAVGVGGVRLQVEADRHPRERTGVLAVLAACSGACVLARGAGRGEQRGDLAAEHITQGQNGHAVAAGLAG